REYINDYRLRHVLLQNEARWNVLTSSLDVIGDTELAIASYKPLNESSDTGFRYLVVYGILQVLFVQQDAAVHILESLDIPEPTTDPDIQYVRDVRNKATGHPTKREGSKKRNIPQSSHFISRISLHTAGFQLLSVIDGQDAVFTDVNIPELLRRQENGIIRLLESGVGTLRKRDEEHKMKFKDKSVAALFPETLSYYFEKVFEGTLSRSPGRWEWGGMHV